MYVYVCVVCTRVCVLYACGYIYVHVEVFLTLPFEAGSLTESRAHWIWLGWLVSVLHGSAHFCSPTARPRFNVGAGDDPCPLPHGQAWPSCGVGGLIEVLMLAQQAETNLCFLVLLR